VCPVLLTDLIPMKSDTVLFPVLITSLLFCLALPASAQNQSASEESRISTDELQGLVETLESETARKEFLAELKALLKAREALAGGEPAGIETQLDQLKEEYQALLRQYGLDSSLLRRIVASMAAFFIMLLLMLLVRLSTAFADGKLQQLKTRFGLYHGRFEIYVRLLRYAGYGLGFCLLLYALCLAWKITDFEFLREGITGSVLAGALHIVLILGVATVLWEMLNTLIEHAMRKWMRATVTV
jgi:hypothetical protein